MWYWIRISRNVAYDSVFLLRISWDVYDSDCGGGSGDGADIDGDNYVTVLILKAHGTCGSVF